MNLVSNIQISLHQNYKILFLLEKIKFRSKFQSFFPLKLTKVGPILEYLSQADPNGQENVVFWIYLNFSKVESAAISVDVFLRSKKRISVQWCGVPKKTGIVLFQVHDTSWPIQAKPQSFIFWILRWLIHLSFVFLGKDWGPKKVTICFTIFLLWKVRKYFILSPEPLDPFF